MSISAARIVILEDERDDVYTAVFGDAGEHMGHEELIDRILELVDVD